jgi:hypothetical protein
MVVACTTTVSLLLNLYVVFTSEIVSHQQTEMCSLKSEYLDIMKFINVVDSLVTFAIPTILIMAMNLVIVRNLMEFRQQIRVDVVAEDSSEPSNSPAVCTIFDF